MAEDVAFNKSNYKRIVDDVYQCVAKFYDFQRLSLDIL